MEEKDTLSIQVTPIHVRTKEFARSVWGYAPKEVGEFLDAVARQLERMQREERDLQQKITSLKEELQSWKDREQELYTLREGVKIQAKEIEEQATQNAAKFLKNVQERAEKIRVQTEEWLAAVLAEVEKTEAKKRRFVEAFRASLDEHYALLEDEKGFPQLNLDLKGFRPAPNPSAPATSAPR